MSEQKDTYSQYLDKKIADLCAEADKAKGEVHALLLAKAMTLSDACTHYDATAAQRQQAEQALKCQRCGTALSGYCSECESSLMGEAIVAAATERHKGIVYTLTPVQGVLGADDDTTSAASKGIVSEVQG